MNDLLKGFPVVVEIPVAWGEMDAFQHVNNVVYFRYFEDARIAYAAKIGLLEYMKETGIGPILASTSCRYKFPLTYPDTISVGARSGGVDDEHLTMHYVVASHKHQRIAAEGDGVIVMYNYRENKKVPVPEEIKRRILTLEKP